MKWSRRRLLKVLAGSPLVTSFGPAGTSAIQGRTARKPTSFVKTRLRIALMQIETTLDVQDNYRRALRMAREAGREKPDLMVFPELFAVGYRPEGMDRYSQEVPGEASRQYSAVARETGSHIAFGLPQAGVRGIYNSLVLLGPTKLVGVYHKTHLYYDSRNPKGNEQKIFLPGHRLGNFNTPLGSLGLFTCHDGLYPEVPRCLTLNGADLLVWCLNDGPPMKWAPQHVYYNLIPLVAVNRVIKDELKVTFWGTRGTLAKPGPDTLKYGGNTSCVSLEFTKDRLFIFDAGTGVTELGKYLISHNRRQKMNLFITHPHWDHINGFPFFMPVYQHGNEMVVYGSSHGNISLREVIGGQMESIYFPVTIKEFASRVYFKEIMEGEYDVEGISLKAIMLNHPGITLGYRATNSSGKSVAYITDNEIIPEDIEKNKNYLRNKLVAFLKGVDILIHDSSYFDDEYRKRVGWGHPAISEVLRLAEAAEVKNLYLSHHDPDHDDAKVAEKEAFGRRYFEKRKLDIGCFSAIEGNSVVL